MKVNRIEYQLITITETAQARSHASFASFGAFSEVKTFLAIFSLQLSVISVVSVAVSQMVCMGEISEKPLSNLTLLFPRSSKGSFATQKV